MKLVRGFPRGIAVAAAALTCCMVSSSAFGDPCVVTDNGSGTVTLPPIGCEYLSPDEVHMIIAGLPPGTTLNFAPIHKAFVCGEQGVPTACTVSFPPGVCEGPGGAMGGQQDCFNSDGDFTVQGTGALSSYSRAISLPLSCQVATAPRTPGQPVQSFDTQMFRLVGQITGDPDFDLLRITAGNDFGLPSPGHTTLTQIGGGNWNVDSFFDITYRIDFVGAPGGPLAGMSGSTTGTIRMVAFGPGGGVACCLPSGACVLTTNTASCLSQGGTPQGPATSCLGIICGGPPEACCLPSGVCVDGLSAGECLAQNGTPQGAGSVCVPGMCGGTGACTPTPLGDGCLQTTCPTPGNSCVPTCINFDPLTGQSRVINCDCRDPNECHAVIQGGAPGTGGGDDGSPRGGGNPCVVPDNGGGTVTLPPAGCAYLSPDDVHMIIDGLPPGTTIEFAPIHTDFICRGDQPTGVCSFPVPFPGVDCDQPGGGLGGEQECSDSVIQGTLQGTGALASFNRPVLIPLSFETHVGPRSPGDPVQSFDTQMFRMFGQITGDPDFDLLRITAGTDFGLPSPGHTTLTQLPGGNWAVDSFFDITYRIDFVGASTGPLAGMSGSTTGTIRMATGSGPACQGNCPPGMVCRETRTVRADGTYDVCCNCEFTIEACCLPDGTCIEIDPVGCETELGGTPQGAGSICTADLCPQPDCGPRPDGSKCNSAVCPVSGEACLPTCVKYNPATGVTSVVSCECRSPDECHAIINGGATDPDGGPGSPRGANPCVVPDNGGGTVTLPPAGCQYLSPDEVHMIVDGLPAGTTIELAPIHKDFICHEQGSQGVCSTAFPPGICEGTGGSMGGNQDCFQSQGQFAVNGTGALAGFVRSLAMPLSCEVHTAPRTPGDDVQTFDTQMFRMFGQITGDPDFDLLRITAGNDFGLPSPGHTTLTRVPGGNWAVDSFFDITYRIDFVGAPGGPLAGMSGSTTGTIRMETGNGTPPSCAGSCPPGMVCEESITFDPASGTFELCCRCVDAPPACVPTPNGDGCQPTVCADPTERCVPVCVNFDPATGATRVTDCECKPPEACHAVFLPGGPGGDPDGGDPRGGNPCVVTDNGGGTITLPPAGCQYLSPDEVHMIIDGLPAGTTIEFAPIHKDFICHEQPGASVCSTAIPPGLCEVPGGSMGGNLDCFDSQAQFSVNGTGGLAGYTRSLSLPLGCEVHSAPRVPGQPVQSFDTDMFRMFGQITGDPDFDLLRITAGTDFGLPSPGHTTLTQQPGGTWAVDSFFDITYRIDFIGAPGGPLAGMSGSTTGTIRMETGVGGGGGLPQCQGVCPPGTICDQQITPNADGTLTVCCVCRPNCTCPGDVVSDGVLNGRDIQAFVDCILGLGTPGTMINCTCVDMDGNGPSMSDIPLFVEALLNKSPCPPLP